MRTLPNIYLLFSVSQLPQWREVPALHIPHSEMVHGKARGNVSWAFHNFCFFFLIYFFKVILVINVTLFSSALQQRSNIPCHLQDISCGLACNKMLPCEMHRCRRICHRGECVAEGGCLQPCVLPRPDCGHPCAAPCHKGGSCPRTTCTAKVQHAATESSWASSSWNMGYKVCADGLCYVSCSSL